MKKLHPQITNLKQKLFSTKQRVTISILAFLFVAVGLSFTYDYFAKGATYGWLQSSWNGNTDTLSTANHTNNQNNWNKFFSKNDNISANTEITLNSTNLTKTDTTTANFQTGTNTNGTYPILNANNELKLDVPTCNTTVSDAGIDQTGAPTCGLTTVTLNGNAPTVGTGSWTKVSGTGGTFANANLRNTTFTGTAGVTYVLRWTISNNPCPASTDDVTITFNRNPTMANAGVDQTLCNNQTSTTLAGNTQSGVTGTWSVVSGIATISNPTYYASNVTDLVGGTSVTLRWTLSNPPCNASTDDVVITTPVQCSYSGTVTDIDGNVYPTMIIGTQEWMAENLRVTKYRDGTVIPNLATNATWAADVTGAYSYLSTEYGAYYNWYALTNSHNLCPLGWHSPSHDEWSTLQSYYGGNGVAGGPMKECGLRHWGTPNSGTNSSCLAMIAGGYRDANGTFYGPAYNNKRYGYYWGTTLYYSGAHRYQFEYNINFVTNWYTSFKTGQSVRCIKD